MKIPFTPERIMKGINGVAPKYHWTPETRLAIDEDGSKAIWIDEEWELLLDEDPKSQFKYRLFHWTVKYSMGRLEPDEHDERLVAESNSIVTVISSLIRDYYDIHMDGLELDILTELG